MSVTQAMEWLIEHVDDPSVDAPIPGQDSSGAAGATAAATPSTSASGSTLLRSLSSQSSTDESSRQDELTEIFKRIRRKREFRPDSRVRGPVNNNDNKTSNLELEFLWCCYYLHVQIFHFPPHASKAVDRVMYSPPYSKSNVLSSCYSNNKVIKSIYKLACPLKPGAGKLQFQSCSNSCEIFSIKTKKHNNLSLQAVIALMEMGFDEKEVVDALRVNNNQQDAAVGTQNHSCRQRYQAVLVSLERADSFLASLLWCTKRAHLPVHVFDVTFYINYIIPREVEL